MRCDLANRTALLAQRYACGTHGGMRNQRRRYQNARSLSTAVRSYKRASPGRHQCQGGSEEDFIVNVGRRTFFQRLGHA